MRPIKGRNLSPPVHRNARPYALEIAGRLFVPIDANIAPDVSLMTIFCHCYLQTIVTSFGIRRRA